MADSKLVCFEDYDVPHTSGRTSGVGCIAVHHVVGNLSVEKIPQVWKGGRSASAHYGIGSDGRIGQYVRESDCAWALGDREANNFSISIECANDGGASSDWHVSDKCIESCINLITDICQRKGWTQFRYSGNDTNGELIAHRWYMATACPGDYLYGKFPYIAAEVQKRLDGGSKLYRVRKSWADSKTQAGAYKSLDNAKKKADEKAKEGYKVYDWNGTCVYTPAVEEAKAEEKVEPKEEPTIIPTIEPTEPKEEKSEEKKPVAKRKQKSILARLFKKYGKGAGK